MLKLNCRSVFNLGLSGLILVVFGLLTTAPLPARAAGLYVDPAAGTDNPACGAATGTGACRTVNYTLINRAATGDVLNLAAGTYTENIVVSKTVTLAGAGQAVTLIRPQTSHPLCSAGGGSLCGGADTPSTVILVQANNVYIHDLTIDGDNPTLTSGVTGGGADLDARNGIVTDNNTGYYDNLRVSYTTIKNIYLRGIQTSGPALSTNFTVTLDHNTVQNVQADPSSIAIFNRGGSGTINNNTVSDASDAIAANWSYGTQFLNNTITKSGSGIHSDNAGGAGYVSTDLIQGNAVTNCTPGGFGLWSFVPYYGPKILNNTVSNCSIGIAVYGQGAPTTSGVIISGNWVNGSNSAGSLGLYITTNVEQFYTGGGYSSVSAVLSGNTILNNATGVLVEAPNPLALAPAPTATASAHFNRIVGNGSGLNNTTGTNLDATNNWWGCNAGPGNAACNSVAGNVTSNPWLVLSITSPTASLFTGGSTTVLATLTYNSAGQNTSASGTLPDSINTLFQTTLGVIAPTTPTTVGGQVSSTFQAGPQTGTATISVKVDNQTVSLTILISNVPRPGYLSNPPPGPLFLGNSLLGSPVSLGLLISNNGTLDLTVGQPIFGGPDATEFGLVGLTTGGSLTIKPTDPAVGLTLVCTPAKVGPRNATLTLTTNDPSQPTVMYTLTCNGQTVVAPPKPVLLPADLVAQLRVSPDRSLNNAPTELLTYTLVIRNGGPGRSSSAYARLPLDPNLDIGFATFSQPSAWVEKFVTDTAQPYVQLRFAAFDPNAVVTSTVVFRPKITAQADSSIFSRAYVYWDDDTAVGQVGGSNAVRFSLSSNPDRNDSGGAIQYFRPTVSPATGVTITLSADFYAPNEWVGLWYTDKRGISHGLGYRQADKGGYLAFDFDLTNLVSGETYFVAGYGVRSGVSGTAALIRSAGGATSFSLGPPSETVFPAWPVRRFNGVNQ